MKSIIKKSIPSISLILIVLFLGFVFSRQIGLCPSYSYSYCANFFEAFAITLFPIIPLFIFSLITYKMKETVFQAWWKFSRVWIPLSMLAILIAPSYASNWMIPIEKGTVAFFSSAIYVVVSVSIIAYQLSKKK